MRYVAFIGMSFLLGFVFFYFFFTFSLAFGLVKACSFLLSFLG